jgi:hypothetical protein
VAIKRIGVGLVGAGWMGNEHSQVAAVLSAIQASHATRAWTTVDRQYGVIAQADELSV